MRYVSQFETFDPVNGLVLSYPDSHLNDIAVRSRSILKGWPLDRIKSIAKEMDAEIVKHANDSSDELVAAFVIQSSYFQENYEDYYNSHDVIRPKELVNILDGNLNLDQFHQKDIDEVYMLKSLITKIGGCSNFQWEDGGGNNFHGIKDYELFAIVSLWMVADSLEYAGKSLPNAREISEVHNRKALNALFYAEKIRDAERKKGLSDSRHAESRLEKEMVIKKWEVNKSEFSSAEKAGVFYSDWLSNQGREVAPRTVSKWIRDHAKTIGVKLR